MARPASFWPLFDLVVRTPRLELRLPHEDEFAALIELADRGIHDPETMPFFIPWTDLEPQQRARETARWLWGHRANWSPENWTLTAAAFVDGRPVGMQDVGAQRFRAVLSVETGRGWAVPIRVRDSGARCAKRFCISRSPVSGRRRR